jgi:glycerophosphoryl diester phosphodiesterase
VKKIAISLIIGYLILFFWPTNNRVADIPFYADKSFTVIAHGNGRALVPGNTLEAAVNAVAVGADILELDVHLSADNILVVRHDDTIDSTTNGSGKIAEMTLLDLELYDVGFHEGDYPEKVAAKGLRIPTLESLFVDLPGNRFLIELKPEDTETGKQLCLLIKKYGLVDQVLVGSFHTSVLQQFRQDCPQIPTSLGEEEVKWLVFLSWIGLGHHYSAKGYSFQLPIEYKGVNMPVSSLLNTARQLNLRLDVWTINDSYEMTEFFNLGVNGIITDRPDLLSAIVENSK